MALDNRMPRADLDRDIFDTAVEQKGYKVLWEQSMYCSCYNEDGQPKPNCPSCHGKGYIYLTGVETRGIVTSINGRKELQRIGLDDAGSAYLTTPSYNDVGFRDRFTFRDFTTKYSEIIRHSDGIDYSRYKITRMVCIRVLDQEYIQGRDFNIQGISNNQIVWNDGVIPPGTVYSLLYDTLPVYVCMGPIHEIRGTYTMKGGHGSEVITPLPKQFMIKREDYLDGTGPQF